MKQFAEKREAVIRCGCGWRARVLVQLASYDVRCRRCSERIQIPVGARPSHRLRNTRQLAGVGRTPGNATILFSVLLPLVFLASAVALLAGVPLGPGL